MSTAPTMPTPRAFDHERMLDLVRSSYARSGTHLDTDLIDLQLLGTADKAACSLLRDQWIDGFPVAGYTELLTTIASLRALLGFTPTPTAVDVSTWALNVRDASAVASGDDRDFHIAVFAEGPHRGVQMVLWGPRAPQAPGALPGPVLSLELATEWGDSTDMQFGTAYYRRAKRPNPFTGQWEYQLDRDHPFPAAGARPCFLRTPHEDGT
ncbi:hypothetical protein HHL19_35610 [Streptomyces sp. R302]|uniref:hypothetical protein n=1 Tax=unclassified Streptomyces TaxID=2593676 RepID=UPI00145EBDF1|nr:MULTISPECIES: hypothetical protein [unclassified Streptomyces]NML55132.1 hypothetical protein [Streptomyces sp. R301]NML83838.1 hypothetical protein [Streptomyces sp. R302]